MADQSAAWKKYQAKLKQIRSKARTILQRAEGSADTSRVAALKKKIGK